MFDLETSIAEWKRAFQQGSFIVDERIDELESHLRESIIDLGRKGLDEEEGFLVATKRLGHAIVLGAEYEKNGLSGANPDRLIWILSGYLGITLCDICSTALVSAIFAGMAVAGPGATGMGIVALPVYLISWITLLTCLFRVIQTPFVYVRIPASSLMAIFAAMIFLPFVSSLFRTVQIRIADPMWMTESYVWLGFGHFVTQPLIFAFCFVALYKLRQSKDSEVRVMV